MYETIFNISISANVILVIAGGFFMLKYKRKVKQAFIESTKKDHFKANLKHANMKIEELEAKAKDRKPDVDAQEMLTHMLNNGAVLNITVIDPASVLFHNRG